MAEVNLPDESTPSAAPGTEMTLFDHLRELRTRLLVVIGTVLVTTLLSYSYSEKIFSFLTVPFTASFPEGLLVGTGPAEAFILKIKVSIFAWIILGSPVIFAQLWMFIAPGLYSHEKKFLIPFVLASTFLFLIGAWFCYQIVFPFTLSFFSDQFTSTGIKPMIRVSEHLSFQIQAIVGFGFVFEMPLLAFFLGRFGIIDHQMMIGGARYAVVIIFVVAAVLTPPDVLTQLLMAGPLLLLYGLSILVVKYSSGPQKQTAPDDQEN